MHLMHELGKSGAQIICATHSPILASTPDADIIEVGEHGFQRSKWEDLWRVGHRVVRVRRGQQAHQAGGQGRYDHVDVQRLRAVRLDDRPADRPHSDLRLRRFRPHDVGRLWRLVGVAGKALLTDLGHADVLASFDPATEDGRASTDSTGMIKPPLR